MKITRTTDFELFARLNRPIHDLHVSLYPEYFMEYNYEAMRDSFKQWVMNESYVFLLLEDNDEPLGYAWIELKSSPQNAFMKPHRSVFVHQISIIDGQKRRGYGSHLMNHIYDIARSNDMDLVELDYWVDNEQSRNFYNKLGYLGYREFVYKKL